MNNTQLLKKINAINESQDIKNQLKNLVEQVEYLKKIVAKYDSEKNITEISPIKIKSKTIDCEIIHNDK